MKTSIPVNPTKEGPSAMAEFRQDQVPRHQNDNPKETLASSASPDSPEQSPAHEPLLHTSTSLEDAVEQRVLTGMGTDGSLNVPDHVPRGLVENPDAGGAREIVPADVKKGWGRYVAYGAAGLAAVLATGALLGYKAIESGTQKGIENALGGGDKTNSAEPFSGTDINRNPGQLEVQEPVRLDPATTSPETFANQPYEMILSETVPFLEEHREESLRKIDEFYASKGESSIPKGENLPPALRTPGTDRAQDIERQIAADTWTITEVGMAQPAFAKNLARAIFKNPKSYEVFIDKDIDGKKHATRPQVFAVSTELPQGTRFGTEVFEGPSLIVLADDLSNPLESDGTPSLMNRVFTEYTYDGDKKHYALVYQIQEYNPYFTEYPERITP